ncbi:hypothetical protein [Sphingorhabdus sp. Alg239-R122]|uniref:hypothetical protein n=1 Tax=Sphingorhabdus sp. Alg239-R122 TaxID=2305989 RepID=UPI0013D9C2DA|nr:hypothetical protein [Sphingorhabdus sp. Alg239-R122]
MISFISPVLFATALTAAGTAIPVQMADGQIRGESISDYEFAWSQCSFQNGEWQAGEPLTEEATIIGKHILRIEHTSKLPNDISNKAVYYIDRSSLAPLRTERTFKAPSGEVLAHQQWVFDDNGYKANIFQQGKNIEKEGMLSSKMYDAMILGIPLSALDFTKGSYSLQALMTNFNASYMITASKVGEEVIEHNGQEVAVNWIDVKWLHEQIGDVYPPGPNASGGRYWITKNKVRNFPRVIRYQTDSYAIEFLPKTCPVIDKTLEG